MKLAIPDMISNSYFPAVAAIELAMFKREGLDVTLELIYPVDKSYAALRDGVVDFVGGSAHSTLSAFPQWRGAKLLCAQAQGMYWFLVMHTDLAVKRGVGTVVLDVRRGDGPKPCFNYTMASIATTEALIARSPDAAAAAVRAIVATQAALKEDVTRATAIGRKLFPPSEAELIAELIRRDLPYYDATISRDFVAGMNRFSRDAGILTGDVAYEEIVATPVSAFWKPS